MFYWTSLFLYIQIYFCRIDYILEMELFGLWAHIFYMEVADVKLPSRKAISVFMSSDWK